MKKSYLALLLLSLGACQMPLAFQDPATARETSAWQLQGRFRPNQQTGNPNTGYPAQGQVPVHQQSGYVPAYPQGGAPAQAQNPYAQGQPGQHGQPARQSLYDWSGGVVDSPQEGQIKTVQGAGNHGLEESVEGRMHIIELYQSVLDERDQLLTEVEALQAALETSRDQLLAERGTTEEQKLRLAALEEANRGLDEENRGMAGRLAKAQIRRLESEKLLLETQIAWHRDRGDVGHQARPASLDNPE